MRNQGDLISCLRSIRRVVLIIMSLYVSGTDMLSEDEYEVMQKAGTPHGAWPPTVTRDDEEEQVAQAGVMSSTFNLINTIIGGAFLGLVGRAACEWREERTQL